MPKEVDAVTKLYDFLLWIIPKLEKFPRSQKFLIADRIETILLDVLDLLIKVAYSKKNPHWYGPQSCNLIVHDFRLSQQNDQNILDYIGMERVSLVVNIRPTPSLIIFQQNSKVFI